MSPLTGDGVALLVLPALPASSARTEQEIALQIGLGNALIAARGVASDEVERTFARARELCREVGETKHLFPVLFGLWTYYFVRAEHRVAHELAEQILVFAERRKERVPLLIAHRTLGTQMFHVGDLPRARAHLERAVALYAPDFDRPLAFLYRHDPRAADLQFHQRVAQQVARLRQLALLGQRPRLDDLHEAVPRRVAVLDAERMQHRQLGRRGDSPCHLAQDRRARRFGVGGSQARPPPVR